MNKPHTCFLAAEKDDPDKVLTEDFQIHFFELVKIKPNVQEALKDKLAKWAFFFPNEGREGKEILIKNDCVMKNAHQAYQKFTADDQMRQIHEAREKRIRDEATNLEWAREQGLEQEKREIAIEHLLIQMGRCHTSCLGYFFSQFHLS